MKRLVAVLGLIVAVAIAPISVPFKAFELLEGNTRGGRNLAVALIGLDFAIGIKLSLIGYPGTKVCLFMCVCAIIGGIAMET